MMDAFFALLEKGASIISRVFVFIASLLMALLMIVVCVDLTLRYCFNSPLIWATEVTEITLLYITFLGAAQVYKEDGHVVIDVVLVLVSERWRRVLGIVSSAIAGVVSAVLVYYGFLTTYNHYVRGVFNPTILETPIALIMAIIPIGCVPLFLLVLVKARKALNPKRPE